MDAEHLIGTLIRGALGSRRKRSRGALRFLTGSRHSLLNAGTLLTAAGVAWGLYETLSQQGSTPASTGGHTGPAQGPAARPGTGTHGGGLGPPPIPAGGVGPRADDSQRRDGGHVGESSAARALPAEAGSHEEAGSHLEAGSQIEAGNRSDAGREASADAVPPEVLRVIRLTISAARADGALTTREQDAILAHARTVGAEELVRDELQRPTPLATLVAGARPEQHRDLYTLAFAVTRADETVSGGERIFLAQLAHQLGIDAATVAELEAAAVARISEGA
jgi:hypothetical protein